MPTPSSQEIFGGEIQYFRLDPQYWEPIIRRFADTGLRCVTTYVQWSTHLIGQPDTAHPAGVLDFDGRTDPRLNLHRFIELVEQYGLNLNFRCGPFCCNEMVHGGYPPWLVLGDPALMVWDWQNRATQGYWIGKREGSQPSYLHPEYLDWCAKWIAEVDQIIVPHLKANGGCITMVNLDNEISYIVQDGFLTSDYNPVNVTPGGYYHQFLAQKYGSIDRVPYGDYASIDAIPAPRAVPDVIGDDLAYYTDWCEFKTWVMCEYLRRLRAMHEANGVQDVTFMTNFNPHRPEGVPTRMPDFEAATGGLVGYDFYRGAFMSYSGYQSMARVLKLMNATVGYTWSAEFMAGTWNKDLSKASRVSDDHMRFMARCALAQGCKSIGWFMFHDRDCWGDAPVSSHGHARPSLQVLRETAALVCAQGPNWDTLTPQTDVAICYELVQHQHTYLGDPMPCADNDLYIGAPTIAGVAAGFASREYEGLFRLVEQAGAQAGVVDLAYDVGTLAGYPLVFLPGSPVIATASHIALRDYVQAGGTLVVSGPWPTVNEAGRPLIFLDMEQPSAEQGSVTRSLGHGTVIWSPAYLASADPEGDALESIALVARCLADAGVTPAVRITNSAPVTWVDWRTGGGHGVVTQPRNLGSAILHTGADEQILFVLNHYPEAAEFTFDFRDQNITGLIDLDSRETREVTAGRATVDLDRKSAAIYRIMKEPRV